MPNRPSTSLRHGPSAGSSMVTIFEVLADQCGNLSTTPNTNAATLTVGGMENLLNEGESSLAFPQAAAGRND